MARKLETCAALGERGAQNEKAEADR